MANKTALNLLEVTPSLDTSEYVVGDCLFISTEIPNFFPDANSSAEIKSVTIIDRSSDEPDMAIYLTTNSTTLGAKNASANAADTVIDDVQCIIPVVTADYLGGADYTDNASIACITDPANDGIGCIVSGDSSRSLYICAILQQASETFAADDLTFKIGVKYL